MFETIKTLIESTTNAPLKGNRTSLKLFCGLVYKHSYKSQKEVAAFLGVSKKPRIILHNTAYEQPQNLRI